MLTVPKPEDETKIDWSVQEWVKTHGFNGAHIVLVPLATPWANGPDFKNLPSKKGLPMQSGQTGQMLEAMLNATEWANANEIIKAIKAPPAWPEPEPEKKWVNAKIVKGRRFR